MNVEEYSAEQAVISAAVAAYVLRFGRLFLGPRLSQTDWVGFLQLIYPEVYEKRLEAADLARRFYDFERARHQLPRQERFLVEYDFAEFVRDMEPAREKMSREFARDTDLGTAAALAVRSVENGGRKQIIRAVEADVVVEDPVDDVEVRIEIRYEDTPPRPRPDPAPEPHPGPQPDRPPLEVVRDELRPRERDSRPVKGWARVATGRETCAWCLMLISRGPVYRSASSAGLDLDDDFAVTQYFDGVPDSEVKQSMKQWHPNCDCKVVPVFDLADWPGYDAWKRAERLWIEAGEEAESLIASGDARTTNLNKETINALRRRIERGDLRMSEYAAAA